MKTIRNQLMRRILQLEFSLLVVVVLAVFHVSRGALIRGFDENLNTQLRAVSTAVEMENGHLVFDRTDLLPEKDSTTSGRLMFQVWEQSGRELARSEDLAQSLPGGATGLALKAGAFDFRLTNGSTLRVASGVAAPASTNADGTSGPRMEATVTVAVDRRPLDATLTSVLLALVGASVAFMGTTTLIIPWVVRKELAPLIGLAEQVQEIKGTSIDQRFSTTHLPGELVPVASRLNELLERLEATLTRERQFSDDLAHEFRTPIAELRSLAEVAIKWPGTWGKGNDEEVLAIAVQMEELITSLLAISRGVPGQNSGSAESIDLRRLIETIWEPLSARAKERKLICDIQVSTESRIRTDPALIRSILGNLVENAVEYTATGGAIQIRALLGTDDFNIYVSNPVQDLTQADVPNLFERFWRKDPSRTGTHHVGLGLALARAFAARIGATLTATLSAEGIVTLRLSGPIDIAPRSTEKHYSVMKNISPSIIGPVVTIASMLLIGAGCSTDSPEALAKQATLTKEQAQTTALTKAPGGTIKEGELEKENGRLVWSFDIAVPGDKNITEVQVDARSGEIVSVEKETPSDQAKEKAADKAKN